MGMADTFGKKVGHPTLALPFAVRGISLFEFFQHPRREILEDDLLDDFASVSRPQRPPVAMVIGIRPMPFVDSKHLLEEFDWETFRPRHPFGRYLGCQNFLHVLLA